MLGELKLSCNEVSDFKSEVCNANDSISTKKCLFSLTSEVGVTINVYDACTNGSCDCKHVIREDKTQLKPCRFAYLYSLASPEGKNTFSPLASNIVDGFKVMDKSQEKENPSYDCKKYKSIFEGDN